MFVQASSAAPRLSSPSPKFDKCQAKWQAGDASTSIDKANKAVDKYLDLLQGIQRDEHGANNAIIGRI